MQYPGRRINMKVVPRRCAAGPMQKPYQCTGIEGASRYRVLGVCKQRIVFSCPDFLCRVVKHFLRNSTPIQCASIGLAFTNRFSGAQRDCEPDFEAGSRKLRIHHKLICPLYAPLQRQGRTQPPQRSKVFLRHTSFSFSCRLWCQSPGRRHRRSFHPVSFSLSHMFEKPIVSQLWIMSHKDEKPPRFCLVYRVPWAGPDKNAISSRTHSSDRNGFFLPERLVNHHIAECS